MFFVILHTCLYVSPFTSLTIHSKVAGLCWLSSRTFKLFAGWLRTQLMHLEDRYPSLLNECVYLLSGACAILTLHQDKFIIVKRPCEAVFSNSSSDVLSVVFVCLPRLLPQVRCQSTDTLAPKLGGDSASQFPCVRHARCLFVVLGLSTEPFQLVYEYILNIGIARLAARYSTPCPATTRRKRSQALGDQLRDSKEIKTKIKLMTSIEHGEARCVISWNG